MTTTSPRSAVVFSTDELELPERPQARIKVGKRTYTARAPKTDTWREVHGMLSQLRLANELSAIENPTDDEVAQLERISRELDHSTLETAIITGIDIIDETGGIVGIQGGFVRRCLSPQDWAQLQRDWRDDDSDIDAEVLFALGNRLQLEFDSWYESRLKSLGLPTAKTEERAGATKAKPKPKTK